MNAVEVRTEIYVQEPGATERRARRVYPDRSEELYPWGEAGCGGPLGGLGGDAFGIWKDGRLTLYAVGFSNMEVETSWDPLGEFKSAEAKRLAEMVGVRWGIPISRLRRKKTFTILLAS